MAALSQTFDVDSTSMVDTSSYTCSGGFQVYCIIGGDFYPDFDFIPSNLYLLERFHGAILGLVFVFGEFIYCIRYYCIVLPLLVLGIIIFRRFGYWGGFCSRNRGRHFRYSKNSA